MDTLLNTEGLTLEQILDSDLEVLTELRSHNKALIDYFTPNVLTHLLTYILIEPSTDDQKHGHKFPFICNEILACEIPQILDQFFNEQTLLDQLFSFLNERKVNLTLAGYFSSVASILLRHNSYELLSYIHEMRDLGKLLVDHLYSTSIMNFVWKLMADEDHGNPAYVAKLDEMVEIVLARFCENGKAEFFMQVVNSGVMICGLLRNHGETSNWSYIQQAVSFSPNADILVNCAVGHNDVLAEASLSIIEAYLANLDVKNSEDNIISNEISFLLELLCEKVQKFCEILKIPKNALGMSRLNIVKILAGLVRLPFNEVKNAIKESNVVGVLIELVPLYPWNSFLHNIVSETIIGILLGDDAEMKEQTIYRSNLINTLISASKLEKNTVGYMGIVSKIGNVLIKTTGHSLDSINEWKLFADSYLQEKNKAENLVLGQGLFKINSNLELPEVDDEEFFDAIEGPEDYIIPQSPNEYPEPTNPIPKETQEKNDLIEENCQESPKKQEKSADPAEKTPKLEEIQVEETKETDKKAQESPMSLDPLIPNNNSVLGN